MSASIRSLQELVQAAKTGDAAAVRELRACGYFERLKAEKEGVPLLFSQRGIWALHSMGAGDSGAYNITGAYRLEGELRPEWLQRAGQTLVDRHESLRSFFPVAAGEPRQYIRLQTEFRLRCEEIRADEDLAVRLRQTASLPFELDTSPLLRMHLFRISSHQHILLLVMHHIIADGATVGILAAELAQVYTACESGTEAALLPAPDWREYAQQQTAIMQAQEYAAVRAFWREQYRDVPPPLDLPADRTRPGQPSYTGASVLLPVPAAAAQAIRQLAKQAQCGAFVVLDTAVKALLQRYTGAEDLVTLFPYAGRQTPEQERLVGMLMRTLPLRLRCSGAATFLQWLSAARTQLFDVLEQQPFSLELLTAELAASGNVPGPLSRVMVVFQEEGQTAVRLGSLQVQEQECGHYPALFDLVLEYTPGETDRLRIHYSADLFAETRVRRLAAHLFHLLRQAAALPHSPCAQLPLLPPEESRLVCEVFSNARAADFGAEGRSALSEVIADKLRAAPEAPAILFRGRIWSAAEADADMNRVANLLLQRCALRGEDRVGVLMERSYWLPVLMNGILRAGGCYVPIDPAYPPDRVRYMLEDAGCVAVFADDAGRKLLGESAVAVLSVDECAAYPATAPAVTVLAEQLAYLIYTSGSTGRPKGVQVEHRGAVNLALGLRQAFAITPADRVLQFASCSFDASIFDMVMAFGSGAALVMIPREILTDAAAFAAYLREHRVTMATLTPAFVDALDAETFRPLRFLMTAGEAARPASARRLQRQLRFVNGYGPTETSVCSNWYEVAADEAVGEVIPIGAPMVNHRVYILDGAGQPCGIGIPGEICIAGAGVARGYHNRPELTAAAFVPDPFLSGERMYRSGDIGYWLETGAVVCLGRRDGQIKIRGFRVETGEIENALLTVPGIREAVVVVLQDERGAKMLAAGYIASGPLDESEIRRQLAGRLPEYMVPAALFAVEAWPLSPSGKIDRVALAALARRSKSNVSGAAGADSANEVWSRTEERIRAVWQMVLGVEGIGRSANFFALGGDSIRAIRTVHALREAGLELSAADLLGTPVLWELAKIVRDQEDSGPVADEITPAGPVAATPVQHWFLQQRQTGERFHQSTLLLCRQPMVREHLLQALAALVRRHEALRLRVTDVLQLELVAPEQAEIPLREETLDFADVAALERIAEEEHARIDPVRGPLFRAALLRESNGGPQGSNPKDCDSQNGEQLLLTAHHLCVDFVTWHILCEDLSMALTQLARREEIRLPRPSAGLRAWGEAQTAYAKASRGRLPFWQRQLDPVGVAMFPVCREDEAVAHSFLLPDEIVAQLRESVCPAFRCPWPQLLAALVGMALGRARGREQLSIWQETHGRKPVAGLLSADRLAGWLTALYPVRIGDCAAEAPSALLSAREALAAIPDDGLSFGALRYATAEFASSFADRAMPDVLFHYAGGGGDELQNDWFRTGPVAPGAAISGSRLRPIPLELVAEDRSRGLSFVCSGPAEALPILRAFEPILCTTAQELACSARERGKVSQLEYDRFPTDADLDLFLAAL